MTAKFQLVIDCADPEPLARFWVAALGYEFELPPDGYDNWDDYWRAVGVSEDELGLGLDCIVDPTGRGPRIWFQVVPEKKTLKNRLHLDITVSGGRANPIETRRRSSTPRRSDWKRSAPPWSGSSARTASTTTRSPCGTPRAMSSTSTDGRWLGTAVAGSHDGQGVGVRSAGVQEVVGPLGHVACGNQTQCDGGRRNRQALSGDGPDSAAARLRCLEASGGTRRGSLRLSAIRRLPVGVCGNHRRRPIRKPRPRCFSGEHPPCLCKTRCLTIAVWPTRSPSALTMRPSTPWTC